MKKLNSKYILLFYFFFITFFNTVDAQNWFIVCSKNTGESSNFFKSQYYFEDLKNDIKTAWDDSYYITNLEYNGYYWVVTFSKTSKFSGQTWIKNSTFPEETIKEKWAAGFYISEMAYGEGNWIIIMSKGLGYTDEIWRTRINFDDIQTEIKTYWDAGYRITNIEYGNGLWALSMAKNSGIDGQSYKKMNTIPTDWIKEKWENEFDITEVAFGQDEWVFVASAGFDLSQTYNDEQDFPVEWVEEKWNDNYVISSFCSSTNNNISQNQTIKKDYYDLNLNEALVINENFTCQTSKTFYFEINDLSQMSNSKLFLIGKDNNYDSDGDYTDFKITLNGYEISNSQLNNKAINYSEEANAFGFDIKDHLISGKNTLTIENTEDEGQTDYAWIYSVQINYDTKYYPSYGNLTKAKNLYAKQSPDKLRINFIGNDENYTVVNIEYEGYYSSCIKKDSYIIDKYSNKKYYLRKAENIIFCNDVDYEYTSNFTLYFDKIPNDTKLIDIIEPDTEGTSYTFKEVSFSFDIQEQAVAMPPILKIGEISFSESVLNAGETAKLTVTVQNVGPGDANSVYLSISSDISGLTFPVKVNVPTIKANGGIQTVTFEIKGEMSLKTAEATIKIDVVEPVFKGNIQGKQLTFQTKELSKPQLILAQYAILESQSATPNNLIDINEIIELQIIVQNIGQGNADNVKVEISNSQNGVMFLGVMSSDNQLIRQTPQFSSINSGKYETIVYRYFVNSEFKDSELIFNIKTTENSGSYGFAENKTFAINKELEKSGYIRKVEGNNDDENSQVIIEDVPDLTVDVDVNIPKIGKKYSNRYALIIGNANYQVNGSDVVDIAYSLNDSRVFRKYAVNILGIPDDETHIYYIEDASSMQMIEYIQNFSELMKLKPTGCEFYVYYSGHGTLDSNKNAFILPVNVKTRFIETFAIKLDDFYEYLTPETGKKCFIFLDACFSGGGKTGELVPHSKVGIRQPKNYSVPANLLVFSASSGSEISQELSDKRHGLFTYFLLKSLQNINTETTYGQLTDIVTDEIKSETLVPTKN